MKCCLEIHAKIYLENIVLSVFELIKIIFVFTFSLLTQIQKRQRFWQVVACLCSCFLLKRGVPWSSQLVALPYCKPFVLRSRNVLDIFKICLLRHATAKPFLVFANRHKRSLQKYTKKMAFYFYCFSKCIYEKHDNSSVSHKE